MLHWRTWKFSLVADMLGMEIDAPVRPVRTEARQQLRLSDVISAFSYALDLTEGQPPGHCIRCCWIGMHLAKAIGLDQSEQWNLYYTLLLKDAGCSSNAARLYELYGSDERLIKRDFKTVDPDNLNEIAAFVFKHTEAGTGFLNKLKRVSAIALNGDHFANELVQTRCERGADIALRLGFNDTIADGIRYLDEHWDGNGRPYRVGADRIPIHSRIALLAQVIDVFFQVGGQSAAQSQVHARSGTWFDPALVGAFSALSNDAEFWSQLARDNTDRAILELAPEPQPILVDDQRLDDITAAFGMIVDSKSPYTFNHSSRVEKYTMAIARELSFPAHRIHFLRRGAFLHDIGKLGVSNEILDKPAKLTPAEWEVVRKHPRYTQEILSYLTPFAELAHVAGAHHEKLDGTGYPHGLRAKDICIETRIITVADIFDAITAARPYRGAIPVDKAITIMQGEVGTSIDEDVLNALIVRLPDFDLNGLAA